MRLRKRRGLRAALLLFGIIAASGATAHRLTPLTPEQALGIEIPGLTHGEMRTVVNYRADIQRLADRQHPTDETFRRLLNYANIQFAYCAWGFTPNALIDEASPFNECSHAYLSASRAVLARMTEMPGQPAAARQLSERIDAAIKADPEAELLCQYSVEPFYTGFVVAPALFDILRYPPIASLLTAILLTGVGLTLRRFAK